MNKGERSTDLDMVRLDGKYLKGLQPYISRRTVGSVLKVYPRISKSRELICIPVSLRPKVEYIARVRMNEGMKNFLHRGNPCFLHIRYRGRTKLASSPRILQVFRKPTEKEQKWTG